MKRINVFKCRVITEGCFPSRNNGEMFQLYSSEDKKIESGKIYVIKLGISVMIPQGFYAVVNGNRDSFRKYGFVPLNPTTTFMTRKFGNSDEWCIPVYAVKDVFLKKFTPVCGFEIRISQFASIKNKVKWLLSGPIKLEKIEESNSEPITKS